METLQTKSFSLEGTRFSLPFNELLQKLRIRYPRAYNLRNSIRRSTPLFLEGKRGLLYEILQDNEEGYPFVHYVLWHNDVLRQIYRSDIQAALIDSQGLFFICNGPKYHEKGVRHIAIFKEIYDSPDKDVDNSNVFHWNEKETYIHLTESLHFAIEKIAGLKISPYGLYILGKKDGKKTVSFVPNNGTPGIFSSSTFRTLNFPSYMQSWEPGMEDGCTYFSDETSIYALMHDSCNTVKRLYQLEDLHMRFGNIYSWKNCVFEGKPSFLIVKKNDHAEGFLSDSSWLKGFRGQFKHDDWWGTLGKSFLTAVTYVNGDFKVTLHVRTSGDARWRETDIIAKQIQRPFVMLRQMTPLTCYLGINGDWFFLSAEMFS